MIQRPVRSDREQEPDGAGPRGQKARPRWTGRAITLLLLLAVAVTGTMAYSARQQWWETILSQAKR